jgi:hypothetical protein
MNSGPDSETPDNQAPDNDIDTDFDPEAETREAEALLAELKTEHRRIDQEIDALIETGVADMLKVRRMKKIKLSLKDQIAYLENQVTPDIIA